MYRKYLGGLIVASLFAVLNSCKKNGPEDLAATNVSYCNTTPDCNAVGLFHVTVSYFANNPPGIASYDTIYGTTTVSIVEVSPGVLQFNDTSITHIQFAVPYDSIYSQFVGYTSGNKLGQIIMTGKDTLHASDAEYDASHSFGYSWKGSRIH